MTKQKSPHPQSQQNLGPEQSDLEPDQQVGESGTGSDQEIYLRSAGAETGHDRAPRKVQTRSNRRRSEPPMAAHEGSVTSRTPRRPVQGISSHSAQEESERNAKVVKERPDAQAA
jgi:hypothetical protein